MSINATARILGISNFVAFPDGETENRLLLELPNGKQVAAVISDADLASIVSCFGGQETPIAHSPTHPAPATAPLEEEHMPMNPSLFEEVSADGAQTFVFGEKPYSAFTDTAGLVEAPPPPAPVAVAQPTPRKSRVVGRDDMGNPIVEVIGAVAPEDVTGTVGEKDEDGVAQL